MLGQPARHLLVDEVDDLLANRRSAHCGGRLGRLPANHVGQESVDRALEPVTHPDDCLARRIDGGRILRVEEEHRRRRARIERLMTHALEQRAHVHGHVAEIDVDRTGI